MEKKSPRDPSLVEVAAIKAVARGDATQIQQTLAMQCIVHKIAGTYEISFRQNSDGGDRATAFAEGQRSVGVQIARIVEMPQAKIDKLRNANA